MEIAERRHTGLGTAATTCGIIALAGTIVPYVNLTSIPLGLTAIVLGTIELFSRTARKVRPIIGIVTGSLAILVFVTMFLVMFHHATSRLITVGEYGRIRSGMTYEQVKAIVGSPGRPIPVPGLGAVYEGYAWPGLRPRSGAIIIFVDHKVFAKEQRNMR